MMERMNSVQTQLSPVPASLVQNSAIGTTPKSIWPKEEAGAALSGEKPVEVSEQAFEAQLAAMNLAAMKPQQELIEAAPKGVASVPTEVKQALADATKKPIIMAPEGTLPKGVAVQQGRQLLDQDRAILEGRQVLGQGRVIPEGLPSQVPVSNQNAGQLEAQLGPSVGTGPGALPKQMNRMLSNTSDNKKVSNQIGRSEVAGPSIKGSDLRQEMSIDSLLKGATADVGIQSVMPKANEPLEKRNLSGSEFVETWEQARSPSEAKESLIRMQPHPEGLASTADHSSKPALRIMRGEGDGMDESAFKPGRMKNPSLMSDSAIPSTVGMAGQVSQPHAAKVSGRTVELSGHVVQGSMAKSRFSSESMIGISKGIQDLSLEGGGELRIRLKPENLGELHVRVGTAGDRVVNLKIEAGDGEAKKILEDSIGYLRESLATQNLSLGRVEVAVSTSSPSMSGEASQSWNSSQGRQGLDWTAPDSQRGYRDGAQGNTRADRHEYISDMDKRRAVGLDSTPGRLNLIA